jgi:catechol 2,3-dioxygenase-like lactoylglutathione lyase family enzyme
MIRGVHAMFYSSDPEATRAFFREKLALPGCDIGEGWWIFDFPEGDIGVHPVDDLSDAGEHNVSFYCDDIHGTVAALEARGVRFRHAVEDHGYGLVTFFEAPGGVTVQLYEPRYEKRRERAAKKSKPERSAPKKAAAKRSAAAPAKKKGKKRR